MKFYARDYVYRIYVVQFPMPRFFVGIYVRYTHVSRLSAVTQRFTQSYFWILSHDTTYQKNKHFVLNRRRFTWENIQM